MAESTAPEPDPDRGDPVPHSSADGTVHPIGTARGDDSLHAGDRVATDDGDGTAATDLHPAADLFIAFLDSVSEYALGRPLRPRLKVTPLGLLKGEVDLVKIELPAYSVAGLVIDRFIIRAEHVHIVPGLPPKLVAEPVGLRAIVSQANIDRWTKDMHLPLRMRLTEEGVVTSAGIGGFRVTEVVTMPDITGSFLRLRPTRASLLGVPTTLVRFLRGYLPLPPLPRQAVLESVEPSDGELTLTFRIDRFEQPLTPAVRKRLRQLLDLPLPGLR